VGLVASHCSLLPSVLAAAPSWRVRGPVSLEPSPREQAHGAFDLTPSGHRRWHCRTRPAAVGTVQRGTANLRRSPTRWCSTLGNSRLPQRGHSVIRAIARGRHRASSPVRPIPLANRRRASEHPPQQIAEGVLLSAQRSGNPQKDRPPRQTLPSVGRFCPNGITLRGRPSRPDQMLDANCLPLKVGLRQEDVIRGAWWARGRPR
jgi:hypothetical protein